MLFPICQQPQLIRPKSSNLPVSHARLEEIVTEVSSMSPSSVSIEPILTSNPGMWQHASIRRQLSAPPCRQMEHQHHPVRPGPLDQGIEFPQIHRHQHDYSAHHASCAPGPETCQQCVSAGRLGKRCGGSEGWGRTQGWAERTAFCDWGVLE